MFRTQPQNFCRVGENNWEMKEAIVLKIVAFMSCLPTPIFVFLTISPISRYDFDESSHQKCQSESVKGGRIACCHNDQKSKVRKNERCAPLSHSINMSTPPNISQKLSAMRAATYVTMMSAFTSADVTACCISRSCSLQVFLESASSSSVRLLEQPYTLR